MIDVLSRVRHGQMLVAPATFEFMPDAVDPPDGGQPDDTLPLLSHRELEVLKYLSEGMAVPGIARALGISLHTCRGYVKTLHNKMGVRTQLEAVIKGQRLGLLGPSE